jgi:NADPH:quinone reductase-like Zn-dependent oxidoreductase
VRVADAVVAPPGVGRVAVMLAASVIGFDTHTPLRGLVVGEAPDPVPLPGWVVVDVVAASLNRHDLWSLKGVGLTQDQLPLILGTDAAGRAPDGSEVVIYPVIAAEAEGSGVIAPPGAILSEKHPGTLAERVAVPEECLVPKPPELSFAEAACLPTAWLTAYRMLVTKGGVGAGTSVLVPGASGGVGTAAVALGLALGARVYATSRSPEKQRRLADLGATVVEAGARLPERVDVVIETVGEATFDYSQKALTPGGRIVVAGATSGPHPPLDLRRLFRHEISVLGTSMGTRAELAALLRLSAASGVRPVIDAVFPLAEAGTALEQLEKGSVFGKIVLEV